MDSLLPTKNTSICIIGSGPAGATASLFLSKFGIHHTILEKARFPRDKICGDGLSGKVVSVLNKLDPALIREISSDNEKFLGSWGVVFVAPNNKKLEIPFKKDLSQETHPPGFVARRMDFDEFLTRKTDTPFANRIHEAEVSDLKRTEKDISITYTKDGQTHMLKTDFLIGADGERSLTRRNFFNFPMQPKHFYAGVRTYYKGVSGMHPLNFIELHFFKNLLPGYFWIFPLPNGYANVGVCVLSQKVGKSKINLRETLLKIIENEPSIRSRFAKATMEEKIMGWGLPLGSNIQAISCERVLLTGDAASMIDPFTGEGIGNAMYSGMIAARAAKEVLETNNFNPLFLNQAYDQTLLKAIGDELKLSYTMQKLCKKPWLFNFIASRSEKNQTLRETISCMFEDLDMRSRLRDPGYYIKLLFNR